VDGFLDRLFLSRIGMETLTSQYLALSANPDGIVDQNCDPCEVCERAAAQVSRMARSCGVKVPKVDISFHGSDPMKQTQTLPLIPQYLFYIVCELLKNSIRATGDLYEAQGSAGNPEPIEIRVASDESQVAILVDDKGGGIPFERQPHVWSYMYSTAKGNRICQKTGTILEATAKPSPLSGYGVGLPLSRLYAEYIGGSLHLMSMPNYGTHAYLFLQQSSEREEALPTYVNWLRKRKLREEIISLEAQENKAAKARDYAEALRLKTVAAEATVELSLLER
jgi:pyruvate dehydrogenase kinase 2/3/4